jgi:hypothetical protein
MLPALNLTPAKRLLSTLGEEARETLDELQWMSVPVGTLAVGASWSEKNSHQIHARGLRLTRLQIGSHLEADNCAHDDLGK